MLSLHAKISIQLIATLIQIERFVTMVRVPPINNQGTANRKLFNILQQVGITILLDLIDEKKEAYFLDVENGTNPLGAFAFRLTNGANDTINFFTGTPLSPTPTVQDVIDNPLPHFQRLVIGTNLDTRRAIAEDPQQESAVMAGLQTRREAGESLAQVIANAVNADKGVRSQFDTYLINARTFAENFARNATDAATATLDENLSRLVTSVSDFFIDAAFARPRRSGDGRRVSKQQHEFDYLSNVVIESYGNEVMGIPNEAGFTHMQVALLLLGVNFDRPRNGETGLCPVFTGGELNELEQNFVNDDEQFDLPADEFFGTEFSYGNFIDSYHLRRLLAELKKIVQNSRADNITEFLRQSGQTRPEYISQLLGRLAPGGFISLAANEWYINRFLNPTRPVRRFVEQTTVVEPCFLGDDPARNSFGELLTFSAGEATVSAVPGQA